jgi:hypothetical protein
MNSRPSNVVRYFVFLIGALFIIGAAVVACSVYERSVTSEFRLGIGAAPHFTPYYLGRLAAIVLLSLLLVAGIYRLRDGAAAIQDHALSAPQRIAAYVMLLVTAACVGLFIVNPTLFYDIAQEDGPVEWPSALLPLAASAAFVYAFWRVLRSERRDGRRRVALAFTAFFAVVLFVIGMEEISWMQRVFGTATPEIFQGNEQQETNLHNMYSSLVFNIVYRTGVFGGLFVLPFLAETAPKNALFDWIGEFLPNRFVLAMSAPLAGFDYNFWNFVAGPLLLALAVLILLFYAKAARERGDRAEMTLFGVLAAFVIVSQAIFLAAPASFAANTWTISEYRELFLAAGLAVYSWETTRRLVARYGRQAPAPYGIVAAP